MKTCDKCGKVLFDNTEYCVYCGEHVGVKPFQCSYCDTYIEDTAIKQCPNCAAHVEYDTYSVNMPKVTCNVCSRKMPIYAKYCPFCGRKDVPDISYGVIAVVLCLLLFGGLLIDLFVDGAHANKAEENSQSYMESSVAETTETPNSL